MYIKFIQASRVHYRQHIGLNAWQQEKGQGPMLAASGCQFRKPLYYTGHVRLSARLEWIKTTSFALQHTLLKDKGEVAAEANDVIVMYDINKYHKMPLP